MRTAGESEGSCIIMRTAGAWSCIFQALVNTYNIHEPFSLLIKDHCPLTCSVIHTPDFSTTPLPRIVSCRVVSCRIVSCRVVSYRRYLAFDRWIHDERKEAIGQRLPVDGVNFSVGGPIRGRMGGPSRPKLFGNTGR